MKIPLLQDQAELEKQELIENLISNSAPSWAFFIMIVLAVVMATLGILMNNAVVIIGSMLIAPILYPILGISLGFVMLDLKIILYSIVTVLKSILLSLGVVILIVFPYTFFGFEVTPELLDRAEPSFPHILVAVIAGIAGSFAMTKRQLRDALPGVAISVSLMPPLAAVGIGLASMNWSIALGAFVLFIFNLTGIILAGSWVFLAMDFYPQRALAQKAVKQEEKVLSKA